MRHHVFSIRDLHSRELPGQLPHRTTTFILAIVTLGLSLGSERIGNCEAQRSVPNIIFILTDDMGYSDPGCYGGNFAPTPNIDRLAKEGIRFTHFYDNAPICSPSRGLHHRHVSGALEFHHVS